MEDFLVPLGFFAMVAYIAKLIGDTRVRRKALDSHAEADVAEAILNRRWSEPSTRSALKWGLVVVALGVGVLLVDLFTIGFESPLAYAILLLATGMALLGYYFVERENEGEGASSVSSSEKPYAASDPVHESEM
jgi:hypothetical protein